MYILRFERLFLFEMIKLLSMIINRLKSKENGLKIDFYLHICKKNITFARFLAITHK